MKNKILLHGIMLSLIYSTLFPVDLDKPEYIQTINAITLFNTGLLALQTYALWRLKKNNQLFGVHPIAREFDILHPATGRDLLSLSMIYPVATGASVLTCNHNTAIVAKAVTIPMLAMSMIIAINMAHTQCLSDIRSLPPSWHIELKSKAPLDPQLSDRQCCICYTTPANDPIHICDKDEHIYCRQCLTTWFSQKKEINPVYQCMLCFKEVTCDNPHIEIISKNITKKVPTKRDLFRAMIGMEGIIVLVLLYHFYNTLMCSL